MSKKSRKKLRSQAYAMRRSALGAAICPKKPLSRLSDIYGHALLADVTRRDVLVDLLNAIFADRPSNVVTERIESVELLDRKPAPQHLRDKLCELDLLCRTLKGSAVNIELQTYLDKDLGTRLAMYLASILKQMRTSGLAYADIPSLALVIITNQNVRKMLGEGEDPSPVWHRICGLCDFDDPTFRLTRKIEIHFIEVQNCTKLQLKAMTRLELWAAFFNRSHESEFAVLDDPIFNKVREFDHMFMSSEDFGRILEERTEMDLRSAFGRGRNVGLAEGEARGEAKGVAETKRKTALTMLKKGFGLDLISELTGLKRDDVAALQSQLA